MLPVPLAMASLKVRTMLLAMAMLLASSEGVKVVTVGGVVSQEISDRTVRLY